AQSRIGGTTTMSSASPRIVSAMLPGVAKRLRRTQTSGPVVARGGTLAAISLSVVIRSVTASPLDQHDAAIVPVPHQRDQQADRAVGQHGDGEALDRLPGPVEHRAG